ncbi:hypothetical protein F966_03375 [Acinetobacter higginsii]|uniref:DUF943 domain-containing protein n=1 Tax=Acinetobacter higginsii TaxID=70347 RepID=N8XJB5_9GAMM|nr:hypothetical protein [Acinetobacter higginsii]ENV07518.1 hypothetical protein F966_03375 [Acinetobacter higginsii]
MKKIILTLIGLALGLLIYKITISFTPCFLNDSICISEFKHSNSVERSLYLNNKTLELEQKNQWVNTHHIYPTGKNGFWNFCHDFSENAIICSFQNLSHIPKCQPYSINKYPIDKWTLEIYKIELLDKDKFLYKLEPYKGEKTSWIAAQGVDTDQEVLCDPEN